MNSAHWRRFAQQSSGIVTILLLVLLLAFRVHACPMLSDADPVSPSTHGCCHDKATKPDTPPAPTLSPCHDGPCLQAIGEHGGFDGSLSSASKLNGPALALVAEWLPPDWSSRHYFPPPFTPAMGPAPLQRSRVLRL